MAKGRSKPMGKPAPRDLQAAHALDREYTLKTHGYEFKQDQRRRIPGDAEIEAALNGGRQFDASGNISRGFDPNKLCPCGIALSKNGAPNCGTCD
jgi:hypothetical protein